MNRPVATPTDAHLPVLDRIGALADLPRPDRMVVALADAGRTQRLEAIWRAQVTSRVVDHTARWLRSNGYGYYTIGSAGHEANAAVALALRPSDPALLHYRSGAFYAARAGQVGGIDPADDILSGVLALEREPIAGGRHKVFGRDELDIVPQTSTIASHLPRAVGLALSLAAADHRGVDLRWDDDAIVVCSFGDASLNHSTAQGALNWAAWEAHRGAMVPILFVCEDNGWGISVRSPAGWVQRTVDESPLLHVSVDGTDPDAVLDATAQLAAAARDEGQPAFLHLRTVRFLGHAGSDVETAYRTTAEIEADRDHDPIVATAAALIGTGEWTPASLIDAYLAECARVGDLAIALTSERQLFTAVEVMSSIPTPRPGSVAAEEARIGRVEAVAHRAAGTNLTVAQSINQALAQVMEAVPEALVFGEDVGRKGGVYGVTRGLQSAFGADRVFDTLLDEQSILGHAAGAALAGHLAIPEIQFLAYVHNAIDQLRGEAATLGFFSKRQYANPMVVRIAAYAYQRGFGGHFHNDNSVASLLDIPGVVVASPAHPSDAGAMLRTCAATARVDGVVSVFLEPIARYHTTDLHEEGDNAWVALPPEPSVTIGSGRVHGRGGDLTIMTWGNGLWLSMRAARQLRDFGIRVRVLDLRWLAPLPEADMMREAEATGNVLVVDETRRSGGVGQAVVSTLIENGFTGRVERVASRDSFVPLGAAADLVLLSEHDIIDAAAAMA